MSIYDSIKNSIKPILYSGLVAMAFTGCGDKRSIRDKAGENIVAEESYFTNWGFLQTINSGSHDIKLGDMDGDGDLDIIVGSHKGLTIYENRIPQKNNSKK